MRHAPRQTPPFGGVAIQNQERAIIVRVVIAAFAILLSFCVLSAPVIAQGEAEKPSKESLLAAWEQMQKDDPYTVAFENTKEQEIYNFETTIFPFKGKIKVLNELIEKKPGYYYGDFREYNEKLPDGDYIGIIEVELLGVEKEFAGKYRYSYATWERANALYYHADTKKWYTSEQWTTYKDAKALREENSKLTQAVSCGTPNQGRDWKEEIWSIFKSWFPMLLLIGIWVFFMRRLQGQAGKSKVTYPQYMDISIEHMAKSEKLLEEISQALKQKQ